MARAHELRMQSQGTLRMQPTGTSLLPALGGASLILIVLAGLVVLLQPGLVHEVSRMYASLRASGQVAGWGDSVLRASVAAACASATIYVLVGFGRGVQSAPFLWLSPVLLGFGMAVMMRMRIAPPLPMAEPVFYVASALVLLGGGALLQRRGWAGVVSGSMLLMVPLTILLGAHAQRAGGVSLALTQLSSGAALHGFVLLVMSVGLGFIAFTTRDEAVPDARSRGRRRFGHHADADQIEEALERARISEIRVQAAEERVSVAQQQLRMQAEELDNALSIQDDMKKLAPRRMGVRLLLSGFAVLAVFGAFMATFFGLLRPLQLKAAQASALATHLEQERVTLTQGFDTERSALLKDLNQARTSITEAQASITRLQAEVATLTAAQAAAIAVPVEAEPAVAAPAPVVARRKAKAIKKKRAVVARAARTSRPERAKPEAAAAAQRAPARHEPREAEMNDDPIAGLDL